MLAKRVGLIWSEQTKGRILVSSDTRAGATPSGEDAERTGSQNGSAASSREQVRKKGGRSAKAGKGSNDNNAVGKVLRSVYQKAVEEDIPAEMLDLLSKLD